MGARRALCAPRLGVLGLRLNSRASELRLMALATASQKVLKQICYFFKKDSLLIFGAGVLLKPPVRLVDKTE